MSDLLTRFGIHPNVRFTTWEDYAILSMVEKGLGIGILPQMILQRIPYEVEMRPLSTPYYREIGLAMKDRARLSPAAKKFLDYLPLLYFNALFDFFRVCSLCLIRDMRFKAP